MRCPLCHRTTTIGLHGYGVCQPRSGDQAPDEPRSYAWARCSPDPAVRDRAGSAIGLAWSTLIDELSDRWERALFDPPAGADPPNPTIGALVMSQMLLARWLRGEDVDGLLDRLRAVADDEDDPAERDAILDAHARLTAALAPS